MSTISTSVVLCSRVLQVHTRVEYYKYYVQEYYNYYVLEYYILEY
jgi:hypothetical protein